jgi:hypothetical protein
LHTQARGRQAYSITLIASINSPRIVGVGGILRRTLDYRQSKAKPRNGQS